MSPSPKSDLVSFSSSDIWSLGVILFMLVCGQPPFQEANDSETLTMIMDCKYTVPPHVSSTCKEYVMHSIFLLSLCHLKACVWSFCLHTEMDRMGGFSVFAGYTRGNCSQSLVCYKMVYRDSVPFFSPQMFSLARA